LRIEKIDRKRVRVRGELEQARLACFCSPVDVETSAIARECSGVQSVSGKLVL
jgi:hypothetical protein